MPKFTDIEETALKVSRHPGIDGEYPTDTQLEMAKESLEYVNSVLYCIENMCSLTYSAIFHEIMRIQQMIDARNQK